MITIFTPSFADEANTNAQNLTVKEVVSRLPPERFRVILLGGDAPDPRLLSRENTEILPYHRHGNTPRWLLNVLRSRVDIYFFPRLGPLDAMFLFLRRSLRLPIGLVTYIVMALNEIAVGPTMSRSIREADCVVGNSRFVSQTVKERLGVETETIYDGIDRKLFHPPNQGRTNESKLTVLYAGSFQARKRVDVVICEAANWPSVEFRLAGKGVEDEKLRALVGKLGCRNVTFIGHLSQSMLAEEMRNADVFLFPSVLEGHPQVLGQAASCGLPAVAMDVYRPDYVVNDRTGYLVKSESELSQKLGLLLADQDLRLKMSAASTEHALQFDWDKIARDWENVFVHVAAKRRKKN
ncbi:MAG TPA: glycosyltransferase family 4 protein [Terriglobales bacterium]|jgi:glycosyltransferase involved in cell wall biosynthesis|nr:glycosyltransferase family 4 protein [Terriglobales bacterium]